MDEIDLNDPSVAKFLAAGPPKRNAAGDLIYGGQPAGDYSRVHVFDGGGSHDIAVPSGPGAGGLGPRVGAGMAGETGTLLMNPEGTGYYGTRGLRPEEFASAQANGGNPYPATPERPLMSGSPEFSRALDIAGARGFARPTGEGIDGLANPNHSVASLMYTVAQANGQDPNRAVLANALANAGPRWVNHADPGGGRVMGMTPDGSTDALAALNNYDAGKYQAANAQQMMGLQAEKTQAETAAIREQANQRAAGVEALKDPDQVYNHMLAKTGDPIAAEAAANRAKAAQGRQQQAATGQAPVVDANTAAANLGQYPALRPYFQPGPDGKYAKGGSLDDIVEFLQGSGMKGYDDPNSELGQTVRQLIQQRFGSNLRNEIGPTIGDQEFAPIGALQNALGYPGTVTPWINRNLINPLTGGSIGSHLGHERRQRTRAFMQRLAPETALPFFNNF